MKFLGIIIFIIILVLGFQYLSNNNLGTIPLTNTTESPDTTSPSPTISGSRTESPWVIVDDVSKISLHSNLQNEMSASDAKDEYQCNTITSGGFYSKDNPEMPGRHLGLFVTNGAVLSNESQSSLLNGFFSISNGSARITTSRPQVDNIALQTGPILIKDGTPRRLSLTRDEKARRVIAAITPQNHVVFLMLYDTGSLVSGPRLSEVPQILKDLDTNTSLDIKDAINLDGGAHSAFISDEARLTDIQTPGSYFCVAS